MMQANQQSAQAASQKEVAYKTVGMEDGRIKDEQIAWSAAYSGYPGHNARLNGESAWLCSALREFIQVDLLKPTEVTGIITQGYPDDNCWVTKFKIEYGIHEHNRQCIKENGQEKMFEGNRDANSHVTNMFPTPIRARYLRLFVEGYQGDSGLRCEYLTV